MRTVKFAALPYPGSSAKFALTFDGSSKPQRVEWMDGAPEMRKAADQLRDKEYPVKFPDASSVKIVRQGTLSCEPSGCTLVLDPLEGLQSAGPAQK